jgi:hypothetical protein
MERSIEALLARAPNLADESEVSRRREDLVERATAAGFTREIADHMYDVAEEEGVDPAVAFELVLCNVGVRELEPPQTHSWEETQVEAAPSWVSHLLTPEDAARERRVRNSFRRLRHVMDNAVSTEAGLRAFVSEPDVGVINY